MTGATAEPVLRWRDKALLLLIPPLVGLGPWASLTPGADFSPYAFRILLVVALFPALSYLKTSYRNTPVHVRRAVNALLLLILWATVSLIWTPQIGPGLRQVISLVLGLLSILIMLGLCRGTDEGITYLRWGYVLALLATGAVGMWEIVTGNHLSAAVDTEAESAYKFSKSAISSTMLNPNNYGAFLLTLLAPILAIFSKQRNFFVLLGLSGLVGWAFMLAVNTESRGAVFGFVVVMGLASLALAFINLGYLLTALFSTALAATAILTLAPGQVQKVLDTVTSEADAGSDEFRRNLTWAALRQFEGSSGLGVGLGGYKHHLALDPLWQSSRTMPAHNTIAQVAAEQGIVGVALVLTIALTCIAVLWQPANHTTQRVIKFEALLMMAAIIGSTLVASYMLNHTELWVHVGYLLCLAWNFQRHHSVQREARP